MLVVGIDPSSLNCGVVVVASGKEIILEATVTLPWEKVMPFLVECRSVKVVVLERPAPHGDKATHVVWEMLHTAIQDMALYQLVDVGPSEWKPSSKTLLQGLNTPLQLRDKHQRDAYSMVLYWLRKGQVFHVA